MKIAIVHDWLNQFTGAEKVLKELHLIFPDAPIYTLDINEGIKNEVVPSAKVIKIGYSGFRNRWNFILPSLIESIDLTDFDLIISSSPIFSKAVITRPNARHICYCYSPTRQIWDNRYIGLIPHISRIWDRVASIRPDIFIAISRDIQARIFKYYRRESLVIYPPVRDIHIDSKDLDLMKWKDSYYLIVSRLINSKNIDLAIQAFEKSGRRLVIIGDGPLLKRFKRMKLKYVSLLGFIPDKDLDDFYRNAKAFVMPQKEDFGIAMIEAMKYGKPVLALNSGSAREILREGISSIFFESPIVESLGIGINKMEENYLKFNGSDIRDIANKFSTLRFINEFNKIIR